LRTQIKTQKANGNQEDDFDKDVLMKRKSALEMAFKSTNIQHQYHKGVPVPDSQLGAYRTRIAT